MAIDLQSYKSPSEFLKACYQTEKRGNPNASLRTWSEALGFSESSLRMILNGKRNLTITNIHRLATSLKMPLQERTYFEAMVLAEQAESPVEKSYYVDRMNQVKTAPGTSAQQLRVATNIPVKDWFTAALLTLFCETVLSKEALTPEKTAEVAKTLQTAPEKIQKLYHRFLSDTEDLDLTPDRALHLIFSKLSNVGPLKTYHRLVLKEVAQRLEKDFETGESLFSTETISLTESEFLSMAQEYKSLLQKYIALNAKNRKDKKTKIYQTFWSGFRAL